MFNAFARPLLAAGALSLLAPLALADGVSVRNDPGLAGAPFPSNRYTVFDGIAEHAQARQPAQARLRRAGQRLPGHRRHQHARRLFDAAAHHRAVHRRHRRSTVSSETVYLVNLGDTLTLRGLGDRVGINQVLWDPPTKTLVFESDQLLQQHSRYLIVITDGVRDTRGKKIKSDGWGDDFGLAFGRDRDGADYRRDLRDGVQGVRSDHHKIVAASLFSTQSTSADLAKINRQIKRSTPAPVDFMIGSAGGAAVRAVFPAAALTGIQFVRQTGTAPSFTPGPVPVTALAVVPGAVAQVAYGRFRSPDYETAEKFIPATGTLTGTPQAQGTNDLIVQVFLPAVQKPAGGWPVAIFGHGFGDTMYGAPWTVAATLASQGIATISINVVGHGFGSLGTLSVQRGALPAVVVPAGGRGIDQDGNGLIASTEGSSAAASKNIISSRTACARRSST
jgi:hypothetical protein